MSTLLLEARQTPDSNQIWREAIRRGFKTRRVAANEDVSDCPDIIGYYGNAMTAQSLCGSPIRFKPIPPYYITTLPRQYVGRSIICLPFSAVSQPHPCDRFIKCVGNKWIEARIYHAGETIAGAPLPDDLLYIQEPVQIKREIRCFVLDGRIQTASQYRLDGVFAPAACEPIPATERIAHLLHKLPRGVVIDFGLIEDAWYVIEFNEAWASGLYECDPEAALDVILAAQEVS